MIMDNGKYRVSRDVLAWICAQPVPAPVLRAFHALLHHQWVRHEWKPDFVEAPERAATWSRCSDLRQRAEIDGRRDNRVLRQMIGNFAQETIFDHIALSDCGTFLEWQFASAFHADMCYMQRYALLDIAQIALLSREVLIRRWTWGSASSFYRAECDGLLVPRRHRGRLGYAWEDVWAFEGGQPPEGREAEYRADLMTPEAVAALCPYAPETIVAMAGRGELPARRVGRFCRFVPAEVARWIEGWQ